MKKAYIFFRNATAVSGFLCLIGSAGQDQMYTSWGELPPDSVESLFAIGWLLLIPLGLHIARIELREYLRGKKNAVHR